jgi:hypothetical protein
MIWPGGTSLTGIASSTVNSTFLVSPVSRGSRVAGATGTTRTGTLVMPPLFRRHPGG